MVLPGAGVVDLHLDRVDLSRSFMVYVCIVLHLSRGNSKGKILMAGIRSGSTEASILIYYDRSTDALDGWDLLRECGRLGEQRGTRSHFSPINTDFVVPIQKPWWISFWLIHPQAKQNSN